MIDYVCGSRIHKDRELSLLNTSSFIFIKRVKYYIFSRGIVDLVIIRYNNHKVDIFS
ncbi:hypothetical protein EHF_0615 [Ehrlichia japonica]|uniref:Uncharacterized protein n=1 Tax=Ehrlichia japonica TaxID=391036 RepID=X5GCT5_9RICK|nr:hypothetical protein EHF_0615 [Ehrlichia japonica]